LSFVSGELPANIQCTISLVNNINSTRNKSLTYTESRKHFLTLIDWGFPSFISHEDLFKKQDEYFPKDKLRFVAKLILKNDSKEIIPTRSLQGLKKLYENMKRPDVTFFTSDEKEVEAHEVILCAMSDVFDAMFSHETTECESGVIDASDLHSDVVKDMVRFMYFDTSLVELESAKGKETELYYAAEKYRLEELKTICLNAIYAKLDESNVLEFMTFAETFNLKDLCSCCLLIILA
jgi:hypothetical protein